MRIRKEEAAWLTDIFVHSKLSGRLTAQASALCFLCKDVYSNVNIAHNPDTWALDGGKEMTLEEVLAEIEPYLSTTAALEADSTISGGEPTLQAHFVAETSRK